MAAQEPVKQNVEKDVQVAQLGVRNLAVVGDARQAAITYVHGLQVVRQPQHVKNAEQHVRERACLATMITVDMRCKGGLLWLKNITYQKRLIIQT